VLPATGGAGRGLSADAARRRLQAGEVPIIAVSGGHLAHIHWLIFGGRVSLGELGLTLCLRPGEVYNTFAFTLPGWRGNSAHPAVSSFIHRYERSHGFTRDLLYVWAYNAASLRVIAGKLGHAGPKRYGVSGSWEYINLGALAVSARESPA
jgi:hypothetical protein